MARTITIRTVGNPALYRVLREAVGSETRHRTASGAARRLLQIERQSRRWVEVMGQWGRVEVEVDGVPMDRDELGMIELAAEDELRGGDWDRGATERALVQALT